MTFSVFMHNFQFYTLKLHLFKFSLTNLDMKEHGFCTDIVSMMENRHDVFMKPPDHWMVLFVCLYP